MLSTRNRCFKAERHDLILKKTVFAVVLVSANIGYSSSRESHSNSVFQLSILRKYYDQHLIFTIRISLKISKKNQKV